MTTCMPSAMCQAPAPMNSSINMAGQGEPSRARAPSKSRPASEIRMTTKAMVRGSSAKEVKRTRHACSVPDLADPRWVTRARGVCSLACWVIAGSSAQDENGDPDQDRENAGGDERAPGELVAGVRVETMAGVPDGVSNPAHRMEHQRESIAEQEQLPEERAEKGRGRLEAVRVCGRRKQIPGKQQRADVKADAGHAMSDRGGHGRRPLIDLHMRRQRAALLQRDLAGICLGHEIHPSSSTNRVGRRKFGAPP